MIKTIKKPVSILLSILMVLSVFAVVPFTASAAEETSTVTWNSFTTSGGMSSGGVTLTTTSGNYHVGRNFYAGRGSGTFTAPEGSVFTKIELKDCSYVNSLNFPGATVAQTGSYYDEWDEEWYNTYTVTWTGESSEVTFSGAIYGIQSIVFTLKSVAPATHTITWKNGDTVLATDEVEDGATPSYTGDEPTKAEDEQYTYTFTGWTDGTNTYGATDTLPAVTGDITYTATFDAIPKAPATYRVTWNDWDGTELGYTEVEEGEAPESPYENLTRDEDDDFTYEFTGWTDGDSNFYALGAELPAVTADVTYTATFEATPKPVYEIIDGKYYIDGMLTKGVGLVEFEGDYYYVKLNGAIYKNAELIVPEAKTNGLAPAGLYSFDADGKMIPPLNGIIDGFYYESNQIIKGKGLVEVDGDIYFVKQNGSVYKNSSLIVSEAKANGLAPAGTYDFDADGKMIIKNGVINGYYYENNVLVKGKGLVLYNDKVYFVKQNGAIYKRYSRGRSAHL